MFVERNQEKNTCLFWYWKQLRGNIDMETLPSFASEVGQNQGRSWHMTLVLSCCWSHLCKGSALLSARQKVTPRVSCSVAQHHLSPRGWSAISTRLTGGNLGTSCSFPLGALGRKLRSRPCWPTCFSCCKGSALQSGGHGPNLSSGQTQVSETAPKHITRRGHRTTELCCSTHHDLAGWGPKSW